MDPELAAALAAIGGGQELPWSALGKMMTDPAGQNLLAEQAAKAGMAPPPLTGGTPGDNLGELLNPTPGGPGMGMLDRMPPVPMPMPRPAMPMQTPTAPAGAPLDLRSPQQIAGEVGPGTMAAGGGGMGKLLQTLQSIKAPAAPVAPKVGTPAAPRPSGQIKGGELLALLQAMEAGPGGMRMPMTLGQALGGR